jgi:hypothetical protein
MDLTCEQSDVTVDQEKSGVKSRESSRGPSRFISNVSRAARVALLAVAALAVAGGAAEAGPKKAKAAKIPTAAESLYLVKDPVNAPQGVSVRGQTIEDLKVEDDCIGCLLEVRCPGVVVEDLVDFEEKKDGRVVFKVGGGVENSVRGKTFGLTCPGEKSPGIIFRVPDHIGLMALPSSAGVPSQKGAPEPAFIPAAGQQSPTDGNAGEEFKFDALDINSEDANAALKGNADGKSTPAKEAPSRGAWSMYAGAVYRNEFGSQGFVNPFGGVAGVTMNEAVGSVGVGAEFGWNPTSQGLSAKGAYVPLNPRERIAGNAGFALVTARLPYELSPGGDVEYGAAGIVKGGVMLVKTPGKENAAVDSSGELADVNSGIAPVGVAALCGELNSTLSGPGVSLFAEACVGAKGPAQVEAAGKFRVLTGVDGMAGVRVRLP